MQEVSEDFLQYVWKHSLYDNSNLHTTTGLPITIIRGGTHNTDSGPDFFNAQIKIGETTWAGNIEIHRNASDWYKHGHHTDKAYNNVVLQVVQTADAIVTLQNGEALATLVLPFDQQLFNNYQQLLSQDLWIHCANQIAKVDTITIDLTLNALLVERLEDKIHYIRTCFERNNSSWEETFYQLLARNFGTPTNADPFELLARSLPIKILGKHKSSLLQIEALLFGQAGFLSDSACDDDYFQSLKKEYDFLQHKFALLPLEKHLWKFLRLRPSNFPTVRIAQFAALIYNSSGLFSRVIETKEITALTKLMEAKASAYWDTHYLFGVQAKPQAKRIGKSMTNTIIINTVIPILFLYGTTRDAQEFRNRAIDFLEALPSESNAITKTWGEHGIAVKNASYSQALIQLKKQYCDRDHCLRCRIGNKIIRSK